MNRRSICAGAIAAVCGFAGSAHGQTLAEWSAAADGNWSDGTNWSGGVSPNNAGPNMFRAEITVGGAAYTVSLDVDVLLDELLLASDDAVLEGAGAFGLDVNDEITLTNADLRAISGGVRSFGSLTFDSSICDDLCDTPLSVVTGTGTWTGTGDIRLMGTSSLTVDAAASFEIDSNQTMVLDPSAAWIINGALSKTTAGLTSVDGGTFDNNGTLTVAAGTLEFASGSLDVNGNANVLDDGRWVVQTGATLDAVGQSIVVNDASVRLEGTASFDALTGALEEIGASGELELGSGAGFTTATDFTNSGRLAVESGATLDVAGGSTLTNLSGGTLSGGVYEIGGTLSFDGGSIDTIDADVTLDGVGSSIESLGGANLLTPLGTITGGGRFVVQGGRDFSTSGALTNSGELVVGGPDGLDQSIVTVTGGLFESGTTTLDGGTLIAGMGYAQAGLLQGNGTIMGSVTSIGTISPGFSPGRIDIAGQLRLETAALVFIEIMGTVPGLEYDVLTIDGFLDFANGQAGTLQIEFASTFMPQPGDFFDVVVFQDTNGMFQEVDLGPFSGDRNFVVERLQDRIRIRVVPAPGGALAMMAMGLIGTRRRR